MATIKRFEDIQAWQKAREMTKIVYEVTMEKSFARDYGLSSQIQRASVSIMANIAEGFGRHSDKGFANFLSIAHGSASEVQSHLYVALDLNLINQKTFERLYSLLDEISRMTLAFANHLRRKV